MTKSEDIVRDILLRVLQACQGGETFTESLARQIEHQVRVDWGGEEAYVSKKPPLEERRASALQEVRSGDVAAASERSGLHRSTIYRMLGRKKPGAPGP